MPSFKFKTCRLLEGNVWNNAVGRFFQKFDTDLDIKVRLYIYISFFIYLLFFIFFSIGVLLMDELQQAVAPFLHASGGGWKGSIHHQLLRTILCSFVQTSQPRRLAKSRKGLLEKGCGKPHLMTLGRCDSRRNTRKRVTNASKRLWAALRTYTQEAALILILKKKLI